jgi:hypothetical protein
MKKAPSSPSLGFVVVDGSGVVTSASGWIETASNRPLEGVSVADLVVEEHRASLETVLDGGTQMTLGFLPDERGVPSDVAAACYVVGEYRLLLLARTVSTDVVEKLALLNETLVEVQRQLAARNIELERANEEIRASQLYIRKLEGILPICSGCGDVRKDDDTGWLPLQEYLASRGDIRLSHGFCPGCGERWMAEVEEAL